MIYFVLNIGHTAFATSSKQSHLQSFNHNSSFCTSNSVYSGNEALYYFRYPVLRIFAFEEGSAFTFDRSNCIHDMTCGNVNVKYSDLLNGLLIVMKNKSKNNTADSKTRTAF